MNTEAKKQYVEWVRENEPVLYAVAVKQASKEAQMHGWLDSVVSSIQEYAPKIGDMAKSVGTTVLEMKKQKQALKTYKAQQSAAAAQQAAKQTEQNALSVLQQQTQRVNAGQLPAYVPNYQPQIVPVNGNTQNFANVVAAKAAGADYTKFLPLALLALIALRKKGN